MGHVTEMLFLPCLQPVHVLPVPPFSSHSAGLPSERHALRHHDHSHSSQQPSKNKKNQNNARMQTDQSANVEYIYFVICMRKIFDKIFGHSIH